VTVPGQRLGKHAPVARQQILNNATDGCNNRGAVISVWSMPRCYKQGAKLGELIQSSLPKAEKIGPEHVKLKNLHC
jgi:hypothetical protein